MTKFSSTEMQTVRIIYTVKNNRRFDPENYDTSEKFDKNIANIVMDNVDGNVISWEITNSDTNDTMLLTNTEYCIEIRAQVLCYGTCSYDPGRLYGPPEDCYPPDIDDVEYETGMIESFSESKIEKQLPELDTINITIEDVDGDGDFEIEEDDDYYDYDYS